MAQIVVVLKGDPENIVSQLNTLALANEIQFITKTKSAGQYLVGYETISTSQSVVALKGDPESISDKLQTILLTEVVDVFSKTFSNSVYIVVKR